VDARDKRGHDDRGLGVLNGGMADARGIQDIRPAGNAVDLAIGVIIGAAFGAIVNSLVGDILSPLIGAVTGGFDFSKYFLALSSKVTAGSLAEAKKQGAVLAWGNFLTVGINFIIIAWVLFLVVKLMKRMMQSEAPKAPALTKQEMLLTEIRDLLKREQT
jgi:large conductance mechanosensitive channel